MMFNLPEKYKIGKSFSVKTFVKEDFKTDERKKLNEILKNVTLEYEIKGEEIPSIINKNYNIQVIYFFDVEIDDIKNASFASDILQGMIKPLCILHFSDDSYETLSFACKRLNLEDRSQVVVMDSLLLDDMPLMLMNDAKMEYAKYLNFDNIRNKNDKLSFYMELYVKSYIISNGKLYSGIKGFLDSSIWYNLNDVICIYKKMKCIENLKQEMKKVCTNSEKIKINFRLKSLMDELKNMQGGLDDGI